MSDNIWNKSKKYRQTIDSILKTAVLEGKDCVKTAKILDSYVKKGKKTFVDDYPQMIKRMGNRVPINLHYETLRLARTEMTRAYGMGTLDGASSNPFSRGIQFALSQMHPFKDICDRICSEDNFELGEGVYPVDEAPEYPFHPNCLCIMMPVVKNPEDIVDKLIEWNNSPESDPKLEEWYQKNFVLDKEELKLKIKNDTIESKENIQKLNNIELNNIKNSGMLKADYDEYIDIINNHKNLSIKNLYTNYADKISDVKMVTSVGSAYSPSSNSLTFNFDNFVKYSGINKYDTLAHEYGHFFDAQVSFEGLNFNEIETVRKVTGLEKIFRSKASSSDEFLEAIRKDKEYLKSTLTTDVKKDLREHNASCGVQDAIDGLFPKSRIAWGHGEKYYNRKYAKIESLYKIGEKSIKKDLKQVYKDLGFDVSNQSKVKTICRQYDASSEIWANVMSAEVCGGETLEYVKKYLPNSYRAMMEILKGVK
ncbi:MAG: hypothetical protein LBR30_00445 [Clostridioides sp.]|jgi:hypothetical protein|nr:hypothetical protein [Clostridioides sp.]